MERRISRRRGFSLLEVLIAMIVLTIAFLGMLGLLALLQSHNQTQHEVRWAYKGCEKAMEYLLSLQYSELLKPEYADPSLPGAPFFVVLVSDPLLPQRLRRDVPHVGTFLVRDVSSSTVVPPGKPPPGPGSLVEITVRVRSSASMPRPLDVELTTRRANPDLVAAEPLPGGPP